MEIPDEIFDEWHEEQQLKRYRSHLAQHPHLADPDHPDPEDYGIQDENA